MISCERTAVIGDPEEAGDVAHQAQARDRQLVDDRRWRRVGQRILDRLRLKSCDWGVGNQCLARRRTAVWNICHRRRRSVAVSNSRRANASSDHAAGAPGGVSGALPVAKGSSKPPNKFDTSPVTISTGSAGTAHSEAGLRQSASARSVAPPRRLRRKHRRSSPSSVTSTTLSICAVGAASSVASTFRTAVDSVAAAGEVIVEFHVRCFVTLVSESDFPL